MMAVKATVKKPINYCYNPFFHKDGKLDCIETWQVLEDELLGTLYPWQYSSSAQLSKRIETLNFIALTNFQDDSARFPQVRFVYKVSARLLTEENIQRLSSFITPQLILCFDLFQLEKLGEKNAMVGLNFLRRHGATIMLEGISRAPIEVVTKYPANMFLLDYRFYNQANIGVLAMIKQLADNKKIDIVVSDVVNAELLQAFYDAKIDIYGGSAIEKPKKRIESIVK
ncbi:MAG: EAL domain-containing protein [Clostridia bacterium]